MSSEGSLLDLSMLPRFNGYARRDRVRGHHVRGHRVRGHRVRGVQLVVVWAVES